MNDVYRALKDIESRDPDGFPQQPTEQDHAAHRTWAIATYGQAAWNRYRRSGWEPTPDV